MKRRDSLGISLGINSPLERILLSQQTQQGDNRDEQPPPQTNRVHLTRPDSLPDAAPTNTK